MHMGLIIQNYVSAYARLAWPTQPIGQARKQNYNSSTPPFAYGNLSIKKTWTILCYYS